MRVLKFRIKNYRSINDLGYCFPDDRITIFAGRNEAGKSAVLEALQDFNAQTDIREAACPLAGDSALKPQIEVEFLVDSQELKSILGDLAPESWAAIPPPAEFEITVIKHYPVRYELTPETARALSLDRAPPIEIEHAIRSFDALNRIAESIRFPFTSFSRFNISGALETVHHLRQRFAERGVIDEDSMVSLREIDQVIGNLERLLRSPQARISEFITRFTAAMPHFVLFSSFDDFFPDELSFNEAHSGSWISDLQQLCDLGPTTLSGTFGVARRTHERRLSDLLSEDFQKYCSQEASRISVNWNDKLLQLWIEDNSRYFPPNLRSRGMRWHLAFYIRLSARARGRVKNIILIDEPGLHLHARAQRDILNLLEHSSKTQQVMFSTHSPYLIEADKLERVRLLLKTRARGTYIENKVHAVSDKETLTPILTAIGMDLNQGIVGADKVNNVVVEGASDVLYLTAFGDLVQRSHIRFVAGGGAGNMPVIGTILHGWGAKVLYLYDNDGVVIDAKKANRRRWQVVDCSCLATLNVDGAIEDVFDRADFARHVLNCDEAEIIEKNWVHMEKRDKVLAARKFLATVRSERKPFLSATTLKRVELLFDDLDQRFRNYHTDRSDEKESTQFGVPGPDEQRKRARK